MAKLFIIIAIILFGFIGIAAYVKESKKVEVTPTPPVVSEPIPIDLEEEVIETVPPPTTPRVEEEIEEYPKPTEGLPSADLIDRLFTPGKGSLPIVQTVTYKSHVPWIHGRPAWIADYAAHYKTPTHFIARSLHGRGNYYKGEVSNGNRFNVLHPDKELEFYLVIDVSRCKLWLYAYDKTGDTRILLKDYSVGLGKKDPSRESGLLTPIGTYRLGDRIAAYAPKKMGHFNGKKVEMIRIFGTRWIPFDEEVSHTTEPAKGFGIHGAPWSEDPHTGTLVEERGSVGTYTSDGCIRMWAEDMEEIYAIIVSKPAYAVLVQDFHEARLPGKEESNPS